jgi:hypothetical protein
MQFTLGADPELFLQNAEGKLISAVGLIGGSKELPLPISEAGHAIQEDNVSVEFNIPPSNSQGEFVDHISFVLKHLEQKAASMHLTFSQVAAASFPEDQLQTEAAQVFGCEPDFNAWTLETNPRPFSADINLRSCGGHVHVGTKLDKVKVIRAMDLHLGVPSLRFDTDSKRRELYGKAGAYRPKKYGVEYRSLSNFWIWSEKFKCWVYDQTKKALEFVEAGNEIGPEQGELIQAAINNGDNTVGAYLEKHFFGGLVSA